MKDCPNRTCRLAAARSPPRRRGGPPTAATRACCGWSTAAAGRAVRRRPATSDGDARARPGGGGPPRRGGSAHAGPRVARRRAAAMPWLLAGAKTLSYAVNMAALRHAEQHGAGDVVFVSSDDYILEGPRSTVVIATETMAAGSAHAAAVVPDPARHHPAGPFRGGPQQGLRLRLPRAAARDLVAAQGVWLVSSITLAARVHTLDGKPLRPPRWPPRSPGWSTPRSSAIADRSTSRAAPFPNRQLP